MKRVVLIGVVLAGACRGVAAQREGTGATPEAVPGVSPTPVLDQYRGLVIRRQELDNMALGMVSDAPKLAPRPDAPDITPERLDKAIQQAAPIIEELILLAPERIEPLPLTIEDDPRLKPYSQMPESWFRVLCGMLHTDAKRCWRDGDAVGAMERLRAAAQISGQLQQQNLALARLVGSASLEPTLSLLVSMIEDGLEPDADRPGFEEMRAIARAVDTEDVAGYRRYFEHDARERMAAARNETGSPMRGSGLAAHITREGMDHEAMRARFARSKGHGHGVDDMDRLMLQGIADSRASATIAAMSDEEISAAFGAAEAMIEPMATAMRSDDMEAVRALVATAQNDPTQLQRIAVGMAELELGTTHTVRDRWGVLMERLNAVK